MIARPYITAQPWADVCLILFISSVVYASPAIEGGVSAEGRGNSSRIIDKNTGLGLWKVKQILLKHTNLDLYTHKEANIFIQELYIYHE